jgi:hypothetical protein
MAEWSEDHVAAIGSLNSKFWLSSSWLNQRSDGALRWKVETTGWEGRGVVYDKPAPPGLYPLPVSFKDQWIGPHEQVLNVMIACWCLWT